MALQVYDVEWIQGVWEAEGCVGRKVCNKSNTRLTIGMSDFDTMRHIKYMLGGVGITSVVSPPGKKHISILDINVYEHQLQILNLLTPGLFSKRIEVINNLWSTNIHYVQPKLTLPWIAGYLDGEGYFTNGKYNPCVGVNCCDKDILLALSDYFGAGSVRPAKVPAHCQKKWRWLITKRSLVRDIQLTLRPMMSLRRQFQIDDAQARKDWLSNPAFKHLNRWYNHENERGFNTSGGFGTGNSEKDGVAGEVEGNLYIAA